MKFKIPYTFNDSLIFIPKVSFDKYEIGIYDLDGIYKRTIKKKYHQINLIDSEKDRLDEVLANVRKMGGGGMDNSKYKNAVNAIFIDKDNNLLSFNSVFRTDKNKNYLFIDRFRNDSLLQNNELPRVKTRGSSLNKPTLIEFEVDRHGSLSLRIMRYRCGIYCVALKQ